MAKRFDQMEHLLDNFEYNGVKVLQEVVDAMSDREFDDIYQHIARMWDLEGCSDRGCSDMRNCKS